MQDRKKELTVKELQEKLASNASFLLLDVRTPTEHAENGHITGNQKVYDMLITKQAFEANAASCIGQLDEFKNDEIIVYCRSGRRSLFVTELLQEANFNATSLAGGMEAWQEEALQLDQKESYKSETPGRGLRN